MAIVIQRSQLSASDKSFIREELLVSSNCDPPVVIKPFKVIEENVHLPLAFYSELRLQGNHLDWPLFPNDAKHSNKLSPAFTFTATLRDYQNEVWLETLPILLAQRAVLISAHCGWGKTAFTAFIASKVQLKTLILYHIAPLGRSWPKTFNDFTDAVVCHIGHEPFNAHAQIYIATVGAALSEKFPLDMTTIGLLAIDEAHCFCSPQRIYALLSCCPKYLILLTATPNRADGTGILLDYFIGRLKVHPKTKEILPGQKATSVERISCKPFTVYKCSTPHKPLIKSTPRGTLDWGAVKDSLIVKAECITLICDWATSNPDKKILIVCIQISQVKAIEEELKRRGEDVGTMHGKASSYDECRVLVSNIHKCGLGFDDSTTCKNYGGRRLDMIILGWTVKDKGVIEQVCGRIRGENGVIVDIVHNFASFTKHYKNREEWYRSRKGVIKICNVPGKVE